MHNNIERGSDNKKIKGKSYGSIQERKSTQFSEKKDSEIDSINLMYKSRICRLLVVDDSFIYRISIVNIKKVCYLISGKSHCVF